MAGHRVICILSDVHYACEAEQARGITEFQIIRNPALRLFVRAYRHFIWRRDPFAYNEFVDRFIAHARGADLVIANGDYSCDTAFIGLSDAPSFESASICLGKLRGEFGERAHGTVGDHELGKTSLFGGAGGLRLASFQRCRELNLEPFWQIELGRFVLLGVTSSLIGLPVYEPETLAEERPAWAELRAEHLAKIREAFDALKPEQRVLIFCHDPTALPFLWREDAVRAKLGQIQQTIIGHLHSKLFFQKSRLLAGMPRLGFLGNSIRRMSTALNEARLWPAFKTRLCPALGGIQLLNDGGFFIVEVEESADREPRFHWQPLRRPA